MHPDWAYWVVGIVFSLLIIGGPVVVSLIYPLVAGGGGWSTFYRRRYPEPAWHRRHPLLRCG